MARSFTDLTHFGRDLLQCVDLTGIGRGGTQPVAGIHSISAILVRLLMSCELVFQSFYFLFEFILKVSRCFPVPYIKGMIYSLLGRSGRLISARPMNGVCDPLTLDSTSASNSLISLLSYAEVRISPSGESASAATYIMYHTSILHLGLTELLPRLIQFVLQG